MERIWNIVYYFAYRADCKATYYFYKCTGLFSLYKLPFVKKRFEKMGIKDPVGFISDFNDRPDFGSSSIFAFGLLMGGVFFFLMGLHIYLFPGIEISTELFIIYAVISYLFCYILLLHKDKYLQYFKEFDKKPHEWKVKWSWISFGLIMFPFIVLALSFVAMS